MKKYFKYITIVFLIALVIVSMSLPYETKAQTIKEFEAELNKYTAELQEKQSRIAKNEKEVNEIKARISEIEKKISAAEEEIKTLQKEIDDSNLEIEKKGEESKKIMEYYQLANGENAYLEYAFGAETITDMIYRVSVVEQLTEYNQQIMKELQELIRQNEAKQKELSYKKEELDKMQDELQSEKERIEADTASLRVGATDIEDQIKNAKLQIRYLKELGCSDNETPEACVYRKNQSGGGNSIPSANGFYRPIEYGYITQWYSGYGGHLGIDMSSSNKSIEVYPITNGMVTAKYYDNAGALVLKVRHNVGGRYIYSTYAHLRAWYVNVGQYVTQYTVLGLMGSTGNSTGSHLHLELTTCDWKSAGGGCPNYYGVYVFSTINPTKYVNFPSRWNNR